MYACMYENYLHNPSPLPRAHACVVVICKTRGVWLVCDSGAQSRYCLGQDHAAVRRRTAGHAGRCGAASPRASLSALHRVVCGSRQLMSRRVLGCGLFCPLGASAQLLRMTPETQRRRARHSKPTPEVRWSIRYFQPPCKMVIVRA